MRQIVSTKCCINEAYVAEPASTSSFQLHVGQNPTVFVSESDVKPPDTSLPATLSFAGYIDLNDSSLSVQSVQAKPASRVDRDQEQIVTIQFRVRRFVCRSAKEQGRGTG